MSRIRANKITNKLGTGAVELEKGAHLPIGMGITGAGGLNITGVVTAGSFAGDGSGLIGVASTDNIVTGTAATFNTYPVDINAGMTVAGVSSMAAITATTGGFTGALTGTTAAFSGTVSVGGTLTYEDVTNIDSVGIITAREGIFVPDNQGIHLGNVAGGGDLQLIHNGSRSYIKDAGTGNLLIQGSQIALQDTSGNNHIITNAGTDVQLYYDFANNSTPKLKTTATGITVTGTVAATALTGDGSGLTGIAVGLTTEALVKTNGQTASLDLSKDDHKVTATGTVTINVTGGSEGDSHTLRIENSGTTNVGFSTYFKFPSGATPSIPTTSGAISLISFTVHKAGSVGIATVLLAGASVNFS